MAGLKAFDAKRTTIVNSEGCSKEVHVWQYFALIKLAISVTEIYYIEIGINDDQNKKHYKDWGSQ